MKVEGECAGFSNNGRRVIVAEECKDVTTGDIDGDEGPSDARPRWHVQCPAGWAAVGLEHDSYRVLSLRCCKLVGQKRG
jgi:hypothetical protein